MRILIVTHYWRPHRGGIETVAWEQARRLVQRGHKVSVLTSRLRGDPSLERKEGYAVHRVRALNLLERWGIPYPLFSFGLVPTLWRLVRSHDVVLTHSHSFMSSFASAVVARYSNRPLVVLQHNPFVRFRFPWNVVEQLADLALGRYTLRSAAVTLAISRHTRRYAKRLVGPRDVGVLYNGVDTSRFTPAGSPEAQQRVRASLGLPQSGFLLFTVRRLVFRNGLDTLLEACSRLKRHRGIFVVIGGIGPERATMESLISRESISNVRLVGFVSDDRLADYYRAADAFVLPSRTGEGFGLVLLEAFASGIPAIATSEGGPQEIVDHGRSGLLTPPGDAESLARAVTVLFDQPVLRREMGKKARRTAQKMSWDNHLDQLEEVLVQAAKLQ